jgi:hypothetical protein
MCCLLSAWCANYQQTDSTHTRGKSMTHTVLPVPAQNPTPDVLESKMRQLTLHAQHTFTWGELSHVW